MNIKSKIVLRKQFKKIKHDLLNKSNFCNSYHFNLRNNLQLVVQSFLINKKQNYSQTFQNLTMASYINNQSEIVPPLLSKQFLNKNKIIIKCCFPYFTKKQKTMKFYQVQQTQSGKNELIFGDMNIKIPDPFNKQQCIPNLMLVPLITFNQCKNRIGYGGGYYDNYLKKQSQNIYTIGIGLQALKNDYKFQEEWDQPLSAIITQQKVY